MKGDAKFRVSPFFLVPYIISPDSIFCAAIFVIVLVTILDIIIHRHYISSILQAWYFGVV